MTDSGEGKYIEVNGVKMYYEEYGSGTPIILIHGGTRTGKVWGEQIPHYSKHFRVIVPDSRGHGKTNNPSRGLSYQVLGEDYAAFIQALDLEKPSIIGWSDGGQIAIELGMKGIDLAAIIVGGAYYRFDQLDLEVLRSWGMEGPGNVDLDLMRKAIPDAVNLWEQTHESWEDLINDISVLWLTPFEYTKDDFSKISAPTLILLGDRDEFIPVETAVKMFRMIPKGELTILPDGNHHIILTKASLFSSLAIEFLLRHS